MKKVMFIFLVIILGFNSGCIFGLDHEREQKYLLKHIYTEEQLELKDQPYSKVFRFVSRESTDRFVMSLYYFNLNLHTLMEDTEKTNNVYNSLTGFSVELYDTQTGNLVYSYNVTKTRKPSIDGATPSVFLGISNKIGNNREYIIKVNLPSKNDTQAEYLKPVFVAGVFRKPML